MSLVIVLAKSESSGQGAKSLKSVVAVSSGCVSTMGKVPGRLTLK